MIPRRHIDLRLRQAWQAGVLDMPDRAPCPTVDRHHCPLCRGPVYVPDDSNAERLDCSSCGAVLVTRRDLAGVVTVALVEGEPNREIITPAEARHVSLTILLAQLPVRRASPNWQARVLARLDKERP